MRRTHRIRDARGRGLTAPRLGSAMARLRQGLRCLMFLPFLGVSLMPQGIVPRLSADNRVRLVLCQGVQVVTVLTDPVTLQPAEAPPSDPAHARCDWLVVQIALDLAAPAAMPRPVVRRPVTEAPGRPAQRPQRGLTGLPPATGPPLAV